MAKKTLELCYTCIYGSNNENCSQAKCRKCAMSCTQAGIIKCKCLDIKWGQDCPNYIKEANHE